MGKKSVNNLYKPMLEHSNVEQKFHKAAKGKTERPDVAVILEPTNIQRHVKFQSSLPRGERQQFSPKSSLFSQQKLSKIFNLNNKLF